MGLYDDDYSNGALSQYLNSDAAAPRQRPQAAQAPQGALSQGYEFVPSDNRPWPSPPMGPTSFGQFLHGIVMNGFQGMQAQNALHQAQAQQIMADLDMQRQIGQGGFMGDMSNPDKIEAMATRLIMARKPGGADLMNLAERMRTQRANQGAVQGFKSSQGILGAGVTTGSPQGRALLSNLTGDPSFDQSILAAQNDALNSNVRLPSQPVTPANPGIMGPLLKSPYVGEAAGALQRVVDNSPAGSLTAQNVLQHFERLQGLHSTGVGREESVATRREIADQSDATRRDIASMNAALRDTTTQNNAANRTFTQERQLAENYNALAKDFRKVVPQFQAAERYITGKTFNSAGDRAMVFQFAKVLDPQDRVGVNDVRDIGKLGNIPERIVQAVQGLAEGKMLPDRVRQEMYDVINSRFQTMEETQTQIEDEYTERAKRYMLNPSNVVLPYARRNGTSPTPGGANGGWSIKKK